MKLTKYQHACFTLEHDGHVLVVDPGGYTTDFIAPDRVVGVVITHEHPDHFDQEVIDQIMDKNPKAIIIGSEAITSKIETFPKETVATGDTFDIRGFHLAFFGGKHAVIHESYPPVQNLGVLINDLVYYPGDSFALPDSSIDTLALPAAAPWLKISETMEFLSKVAPRFTFPTHDAILSDTGKGLVDSLLGGFAKSQSIEYARLDDSIEI